MISTKITKRIFVAFCDFFILSLSLYISLSIRNLSIIGEAEFAKVFYPFLLIIIINLLAFYIYGLYDKMTVKIYKELNQRIIGSQILSSVIGAIIFYTSPSFTIAPKTILIIYILISSGLIFGWRRYVRVFIKAPKTTNLLLVAEGSELQELKEEMANNKVLGINKIDFIDLSDNRELDLYTRIKNKVHEGNFNMLAINMHHPHIKNSISLFYELLLEKVDVVNFADLYEEVLQKIPLENIDAGWFFNNLYQKKGNFYEKSKRFIDLLISVPAFFVSLIFYPFVYIGLRIQDKGDLFYVSHRVGKNNEIFEIYKFRSMTQVKNSDGTSKDEASRVTKFGKFLRKTRIDELPQLINIINGELSLIGPRPEIPPLVKEYSNQIPFYGIRHTITPGLSGYAQIYQEQKSVPKFGIATDATKEKLSYDIYYLKHRSILLDVSLTLRTIKNLLGKTGI